MASQTTGECLVCGAETKNRCSNCSKAGIDLFFCSPEHQKLVWFAHRLFCGPGKARPPAVPPLSAEEIANAKIRRNNGLYWIDRNDNVPMPPTLAKPTVRTLALDLADYSQDSFDCVMHFIDGPVNDCTALLNKPLLVAVIRSTRLCDPTQMQNMSIRRLPPNYVIDHMSKLFCKVLAYLDLNILKERVTDYTWWSPLLHRVLLVSALVKRALEQRRLADIGYANGAYNRLVSWLRGGMSTDDPAIKASFAELADVRTTELKWLSHPDPLAMLESVQ